MNLVAWIVIALSIALGGFAGGVAATRAHYRPIVADMKERKAAEAQKAAEAVTKAVTDNAELITKLEVTKNEENTALTYLVAHPVERVLLPKVAACASGGTAATAAGSTVQAASTERASDPSQSALDEFKREVDADAIEWSNALTACSVVMDWAKAQ